MVSIQKNVLFCTPLLPLVMTMLTRLADGRFMMSSSSSSSCGQRSLLSWSIARRGVCAQITCRKLVLRVLVVTQRENRMLQQNKK